VSLQDRSGLRHSVSSRNIGQILNHCSTADVFVKLSLVKAYCLPVLIYCIGALNLPVAKIKDLGVCWNDCFRNLFGCKRF